MYIRMPKINIYLECKSYFYQIKCCFYPKNDCMNQKKILQQIFPHKHKVDSANSYVPRLYHNKRENHNKQNVEP